MWECPRWDAIRQAEASRHGRDAPALAHALGSLTKPSLLRPKCPLRAQAALAAQSAPPAWEFRPIPTYGDRVTAWADGAACDVGSEGLASAAWAVHFGIGAVAQAGAVTGAQTAQRAELFAAVMAVSLAKGPLTIVTDSQWRMV